MSAAIIGLYVWGNYFGAHDVGQSLIINLPTVVLAAITAIVCIVFYFLQPSKSYFPITLTIYLLITATAGLLINNTGGTSSPFVSLWILISFFAGFFSIWGLLPILLASGIYSAFTYINGGLRSGESLAVVVFSSLLPLIAGLLIWRNMSGKDESSKEDRSFKNLATELNEVASKSEVVINAIGDGVMAIDSQGVIQLINPAAQRIIGWGKQDALALNYKSVLQMLNNKDEPLDVLADPIQQVLNINQQIRTNDLSLMTNSGKKIMISLVVSPVGDVGSGVIAVFHDITKEKAEEREQAEFISTASHEMRTPVASIEGYLGLALNPQTAQVDNRARDYILKAHGSAQHLGRLFQDLLDVSKADDGRISNLPKVVDMVGFVHEIVQGLEQKATDKGLKLSYKPMPEGTRERHIAPVYSVNLDNDHIREIMNNLIENAIKYTPMGEVVVDINGDDEHVVVSVKDSGIGIPAEDMPHLFQKFYRVDDKNTREIGGTGLGLYLSRRLSEIMGGRIWAESVYSKGSTFFVELPRISSQEATQIAEQQAFQAQQEANQIAAQQPGQPATTPEQIFTAAQQATPQQAATVVSPVQTMQPVLPTNAAASATAQSVIQQLQRPAVAPTIQPLSRPQTQPQPINEPIVVAPTNAKPANSVPRGQALTPEQIAAYVARQRELAKQQSATQTAAVRPQSVTVPSREVR